MMITVYWILGSILYCLIGIFITIKFWEVTIYDGIEGFLGYIIIWPFTVMVIIIGLIAHAILLVSGLFEQLDKIIQKRRK